jgi:hypothetical protein
MNERRDLGVTLVCAAMLMLSTVYLTQCSARTQAPEPASQTSAATRTVTGGASAQRQREAGRDAAEKKEDEEESALNKNIGHAIQTIGADPELRKTYGFDQ